MAIELGALNMKITTSGTDEALGGIAKIGSAAGEIALKGIAAMGTAVGALTTLSVKSYAEYEQLTGGVDTLFQTSSSTVQKYADEAFKACGLSANAYMETVTGFSASLLQSVGGDTAKAADSANQAVIDMSDNANKMGTSMESIQNAYQGFAKQNYTMLDNLKLGYGGTKEEMQRLLEDATKLTGKKYDVSNFNDITQAIHAIQNQMGITGTTSKEAMTTISGSVAMVQNSFKNLLNGLSTGQNLDALIAQMMDSIITAGNNLLPIITTAIDSIVKAIPTFFPLIIDTISTLLPQLLEAAVSLLTSLMDALLAQFPALVDLIVAQLPLLINALIEIVNGLVTALPTMLPPLLDGVIALILMLCANATNIIQPIIAVLPTLIMQIVTALTSNLPVLVQGVITLVVGIVQMLPQIVQMIVPMIPQIITQVALAITQCIPMILQAVVQIISGINQTINAGISSIVECGRNLVEGLWNGINNATQWLIGKIKSFCNSALDAIKAFFGIHSPSTVTAEFGRYLVEGLAVGIEEDDSAEEALEKKCKNLLDILKDFTDDFDLNADIAKAEYDLWEAENQDATDTDKFNKKQELLNKQIQAQMDTVEVTRQALEQQAELTGTDSEEYKEIYLQLIKNTAEKQDLINELSKNAKTNEETLQALAMYDGLSKDDYMKQLNAKVNYDNILRSNGADWKSKGYTSDYQKYLAKEQSGWNGTTQVTQNFYVPTATPSEVRKATKTTINNISKGGKM